MRLLLDTHAFLWFIGANPKLNNHVKQLIENTDNERFLSIASLWEMAIKVSIGKLNLKYTFPELVRDHVKGNMINLIHIKKSYKMNLTLANSF